MYFRDNVNEVMMGSPNGKKNSTDLIILSGANGKLLLKAPQNCSNIHKLQIDTDYVVKFICMVKEDTEQQILRNLTDFYSQVSKKPLNLKKLEPIARITQHKFYGRRATTLAQTTITNVQDKELVIENKGSWPRESRVSIKLTSVVSGVKKTHYEYKSSKVYAMVPLPIVLNNTKNGNIHGFIIKLWIWNGTELNYNLENSRFKRSTDKRDLKAQRSNYTNQTFTNGSIYKTKVLFLKESIMLIVFNSSVLNSSVFNMKVENVSQSNIVQFCQRSSGTKSDKKSDNETVCQPDLNYQENSVLITDIDGDGLEELVSYYSTFINENSSEDITADRWKLKTFIQMFKLETELPKLYALNVY